MRYILHPWGPEFVAPLPATDTQFSPRLRLALWARWVAPAGVSLGKRLRILKWADAADRGRLSR